MNRCYLKVINPVPINNRLDNKIIYKPVPTYIFVQRIRSNIINVFPMCVVQLKRQIEFGKETLRFKIGVFFWLPLRKYIYYSSCTYNSYQCTKQTLKKTGTFKQNKQSFWNQNRYELLTIVYYIFKNRNGRTNIQSIHLFVMFLYLSKFLIPFCYMITLHLTNLYSYLHLMMQHSNRDERKTCLPSLT